MGYWKSKVIPKFKKIFDKNGKKEAAAEASKSFDESKEEINKEFEEKKEELQPKVLEIYEAASVEVKTVIKKPTQAAVKKHSTLVNKFLEDLVKIDFPGSKHVSEASAKYGPHLVSSSVFFIFEKVTVFIPPEPTAPVAAAPRDLPPPMEGAPVATEIEEAKVVEVKKEIEEVTPTPPTTKTEETPAPPPVEEPPVTVVAVPEPPKKEEGAPEA